MRITFRLRRIPSIIGDRDFTVPIDILLVRVAANRTNSFEVSRLSFGAILTAK